VVDGGVAVLATQAAPACDGGVWCELVSFLVQQTQLSFAHQLVSVVGDGVTHDARCFVKARVLVGGPIPLVVEETTHDAAAAADAMRLRRSARNARST